MKPKIQRPRILFILVLLSYFSSTLFGTTNGAYRVGPKDLLQIDILESKEMSGTFRVNQTGVVNIPIVGDFEVAGKTARDIEISLRQLLESKYLQKNQANVSIRILEYRSRPISVIGAVRQAGPLDLSGNWSLIEALTAAGGLAGNYGKTLYIMRRADNGLASQVEIPIRPLMFEGDQRFNIPIFAGDMINVPEATEIRISCLGEVESPGSHQFMSTDRVTLLSLVAEAGGLSDRASGKIIVKRETRNGTIEEIKADYHQIVDGKRSDFPLNNGDVVIVKKSFF